MQNKVFLVVSIFVIANYITQVFSMEPQKNPSRWSRYRPKTTEEIPLDIISEALKNFPENLIDQNLELRIDTKTHKAAYSINTWKTLIIGLNPRLLPFDPVHRKAVIDHEIGHYILRHHRTRYAEGNSGACLASLGAAGIMGSLLPFRQAQTKIRSLNIGLGLSALSLAKITLDNSSVVKKIRASWYRRQESEASKFAIKQSDNPKKTAQYLVSYNC